MQKLKVFFRKAKAKLTGIPRCSYETVHGHDFKMEKIVNVCGLDVGYLKCKCGQRATLDKVFGLVSIPDGAEKRRGKK